MPIPASLLRAVFVVFAAAVWGLTFAALEGRGAEAVTGAVVLLGAVLVASRGGQWIALGAGASMASVSALTIGAVSAPVALLVNVTGVLLVMSVGLRLALDLIRESDSAARPVLLGVVGLMVSDYAIVHGTATDGLSALALVLPAAALLPLAYGACAAVLTSAPAPAPERAVGVAALAD